MAVPAMSFILASMNELNALAAVMLLLPAYAPVSSMVTAYRFISSVSSALSCSCMVGFSGDDIMKLNPICSSVLLTFTPTSNGTGSVLLSSKVTEVVTLSSAVTLSEGFSSSPLQLTSLPSLMARVFSGMTGRFSLNSPSLMA